MKRSALRTMAAAIAFSLFAPGVAAAEKVVLQLRWEPQFQFAGYYAALWRGFYAEAGLDVEIRSAVRPDRSVLSATKEVAEGRAQFGIGAADILTARDKGAALTVAAVIFQQSPVAVFAREDANVRSPADLIGLRVKRVPTDASDAQFVAMLVAEGIDPEIIKPHLSDKWDGHTSALLAENKLDAFVGYSLTALWRAKVRGQSLTILRPAAYGVDFYGDSIFTTEQFAKRNPELVSRFIAATLRGWEYALQNAESVATRLGREFPRTFKVRDPVAFNLFQIQEVRGLTLHPVVQIGHVNPDRWRRMHLLLKRAGLVSGDLDPRAFVFDPDRDARSAQRRWLLALAVIVGLAVVLLVTFFIWTRSLRRTVGVRTRELAELNADLEHRVEARTAELHQAQGDLIKHESLATLGRLAATVSHELRNPLGVIGTSLAVVDARTRGHDLGLEQAIERMKRSIGRCDRIISEMLDFARDREPLNVPTDIDAWLADLMEEQDLPAEISLRMRLNGDSAAVDLDPELFRRAVINLVENARDALMDRRRDGEGAHPNRLVVETRRNGDVVEITIGDDGPGMADEVLANAFEPLFSTKAFGVGLGLPIVKKIVEQHDGSIAIDSEPDEGTRVTLSLPVSRFHAEASRTA